MPTDETTNRRVLELRNRAFHLRLKADREGDEGRRRHMLDLARTYQRAADDLMPLKPAAETAPQPNGHGSRSSAHTAATDPLPFPKPVWP